VSAQQQVGAAYRDPAHWLKMSILNTAASGRFSTDRTISEYNKDIWKLNPIDMTQAP
jgi:glycogen phosphorylase